MNKIKYIVPVLIALVGLGLQQVKADTLSYDIRVGNPAVSGYLGPYVSVTVNQTDSTHATITFTSLTNSGNIYLMGGVNAVAVNVNAASWTVTNITGSNSGTGFTPGPYSNDGSGNVDGFGVYNQRIRSSGGFTRSASTIGFTLTNTSGTWANAAAVLINNSSASLAAAHIFVTGSPANAANGALTTGFAAAPDGGTTVMLLGAALVVLGVARRYIVR